MKLKNIFDFIVIVAFSGLMFSLAYKGYKHQNIDVENLKTHTGRIELAGKILKKSSKTRSIVFYMKLNSLEQKLGVYRMNGDYNSLLNNLHVGDTISVYYQEQEPTDININVVQIIKNKSIVLDPSEYIKKESSLIWIGLISGTILLLISFWYLRKYVLILF